MSYYPLLSAPNCLGITTVFNYAPNNWEEGSKVSRYLNVSWSDGRCWQTRYLQTLDYGQSCAVHESALSSLMPSESTGFLSLTKFVPEGQTATLPLSDLPRTNLPAWRATLALQSQTGATTSYQGEVDPFPAPGSLITFGYFLQAGDAIQNLLLFLNLEVSPKVRSAVVEIRDAATPKLLRASHRVVNNRLNIIPLDYPGIQVQDLPLVVCRQMSGIPLYFSHSLDMEYLSLEHTHPPASTVMHGNRLAAQKIMKKVWFAKMGVVAE